MQKNAKGNPAQVLYVDGQILQTAAFDRGMGKYTTSLLKAYAALLSSFDDESRIVLILNKNLDSSPKRITAIKALTNCNSITLLDLPIDIATDYKQKNAEAEHVISEYISESNVEDTAVDYLLMAPFFVGFCSVFPTGNTIRKFSIVYDITPQKIEHIQKVFPDDIYYQHYRLLIEADHLFTISQAVKSDLEAYLGISAEKMTSIDGGPFTSFEKSLKTVDYKKPFIHLPSGGMIHKNNERAVRAFAKFNERHNQEFTLYITSTFDEAAQKKLQSLSSNIEFTGNISDEEMHSAFKDASVVLFPSLAEGLGMPVLEASLYDTPVACSNIPVLKELSSEGFYLFDPTNVEDMAKAIDDASRKRNWQVHSSSLATLRARYTWARSAQVMNDIFLQPNVYEEREAQTIVLECDNNSDAAANLTELVYGALASRAYGAHCYDVRVTESNETRLRYFAKQIDSRHGNEPVVRIRRSTFSLKRLFNAENYVKIDVNGVTMLELAASRVIQDHALSIERWSYSDKTGQTSSVSHIANTINDRFNIS